MRVRRWAALPGLAVAATAVALPTATTAGTAATGAVFGIRPLLAGFRLVSTKAPPTTAQCEKAIHLACYGADQIERAYNLRPLYAKGYTGRGRTIVLVDSFGSPTIRHDLAVFDKAYHLPAPPSFRIVRPDGPVPKNYSWAGETTLDVEYSHTVAPGANIVLVETPVAETEGTVGFPQIVRAENYVIDHNMGDVISQSFGATEQTFPSQRALRDLRSAYVNAERHHVTVLASTGDSGAANTKFNGETYYLHPTVGWPASDPLVTAVGGTALHLNGAGKRTSPDTVWNDTYNKAVLKWLTGSTTPVPVAGAGGLSSVFSRPTYQRGVARIVGGRRGLPDISMSASCSGNVLTYASFPGIKPGWYGVCGTSEASPLFAGIVAVADQWAHTRLGFLNPELYLLGQDRAPGLVDVTKGNNTVTFTQHGHTYTVHGYRARRGYDLASGWGTVNAARFVPELASLAGGRRR